MSSSAESIEGPDIIFEGANGNECEAFVVAVRDLAFAKGMDEDHHWMLRFATTRLRGKALRWHAGLESSIKEDWNLFVQALFDQYPSAEGPGDAGITTSICPQYQPIHDYPSLIPGVRSKFY
ncbi:hypothetical protein M407DRAFT_117177 [Tulasnella calospora MUT 4182]|uniref:Retrotransposon gag domain-containing protein n=1 Tax=Tulasnella calospora MUT 4182 TaxID=1051891 RepID=A0A0C3QD02_9AGAM|nr:hypothetical protein M407DRAFT_117177 [Tulasnella calospora MUT 4182]